MKSDYKPYVLSAIAFVFVFGIFLIGNSMANVIEGPAKNMAAAGSGVLMSERNTGLFGVIAGLGVAFISFLIFIVLAKRKGTSDEEY
jgi:hypothetical protein